MFASPCRRGTCGELLIRNGTMVLTVPSLVLLIALMALTAKRLIPPAVTEGLLMINFIIVVWLLPYFAHFTQRNPEPEPPAMM